MRAALALAALVVIAGTLVSGGSRADSVRHRYLPGSNQLRTVHVYGTTRVVAVASLGDSDLVRAAPRWLAKARPLGNEAPGWAKRMYLRSLLVLRALTDSRIGAVTAGARDGWAYVWPRDAGAVAIALAESGFQKDARNVVRFLLRLELGSAARFHGDGSAVEGRDAQGDAAGWISIAAQAAGMRTELAEQQWRNRADYQENGLGDYIGNALATEAARRLDSSACAPTRRVEEARLRKLFGTPEGTLTRRAGDANSGLDSAAAWAVRPFPHPALYPLARRTLRRLAAGSGGFGIVPSESWDGGDDPWTAPTAWTAWSLAALGERRAALHLMTALRRAATPTGMLPERVDARTGVPTSTTPLAWSHAFAILAIRELWP